MTYESITGTYDPAAHAITETALQARKAIGLLTEDEVAAMLQLTSAGTLATWRSQKTGPAPVKLGKRVFYTVASISAWINQNIVKQDNERAAALPENQPANVA
jgi:predicted DNA-binding transcriptional regulator AlpA